MKSPSKYEDGNNASHDESLQRVNSALDHSVNHLSDKTLADLAHIRAIALAQKNSQDKPIQFSVDTLVSWLLNPMVNIGIPVAGAVMIAITVNYLSVESIPELPLALMASDIPNEEFAMLENLEFVTWLAENEQSTLL